jgi:hypothetical protein
MSSLRHPVADPRAVSFALARVMRWLLIGLGLALIVAGFAIAPLPGPLGVPLTVAGLMLVLRNSFRARRQFIRFQRAHPKIIFPLRRLLRREPEVVAVAWQSMLRTEKLILRNPSWRFLKRLRRSLRKKGSGLGVRG